MGMTQAAKERKETRDIGGKRGRGRAKEKKRNEKKRARIEERRRSPPTLSVCAPSESEVYCIVWLRRTRQQRTQHTKNTRDRQQGM